MSMILDVLVIAVFAVCVFLYTKRGFIKGVLGLCGFFVALIAAALLRPLVAPIIVDVFNLHGFACGASGTLHDLLNVSFAPDALASVIAFFLLFVLFMVAVKLVTFLLDRLCRLPVLKQANRLLGCALGVVIGLLYAQLLSVLLFTFAELLVMSQDFITAEAFEGSVVARWMFDHNLFRMLINLL